MASSRGTRAASRLPAVGGGAGRGGEAEQGEVNELSSLRFAAVARQLGDAARQRGLEVPAFRSPPRAPGVRRSIRRESDGSATVSVALRGRPALAVVADMIDGLMTAAGLTGIDAGVARDDLWSAALVVFSAAETGEALVPARSAA